ncbi:MAG: hypothetical protein WCJ29_04830 [bacterium]
MNRRGAIFIAVLVFLVVLPLRDSLAQMSSTNFEIPAASINDAGGKSTSASYILNDTFGEIATDVSETSPSFNLQSGFQAMKAMPVFSFTISTGTLSLTPEVGSIVQASVILTTTNTESLGYTTTIVDDGALRSGTDSIADVSDGAVGPAGTAEYGILLTGADKTFSDERATVALPRTSPANPRIIASSSSLGSGRATTVTFKLGIAPATPNGVYSHSVTFTSSPNY